MTWTLFQHVSLVLGGFSTVSAIITIGRFIHDAGKWIYRKSKGPPDANHCPSCDQNPDAERLRDDIAVLCGQMTADRDRLQREVNRLEGEVDLLQADTLQLRRQLQQRTVQGVPPPNRPANLEQWRQDVEGGDIRLDDL